VWRDPRRPGFIGDMPHAWVEAEFINSVRSLFLYEDGPTLVLGAGLRPEWVNDPAGVSIKGWPTEFGTASYSVHADQIGLDLELDAGLRQRPGQYVFIIPTDRPIRSIQVDGSPRPAMPMRRISLDGSPVHVRVVWDHP
jgi:hypothetical protein